jgi:hypothetical protein
MSRYRIIEQSVSCHCCFDFTVVDSGSSYDKNDTYNLRTYGFDFVSVCECFTKPHAELICNALNQSIGDAT